MNQLENLMIASRRAEFQQKFAALDLNGSNAATALDALIACAKVALDQSCAPYIGGATTQPPEPRAQAIKATQAYLDAQIALLPQDIPTTIGLMTGSRIDSYRDGVAYLSWYSALRSQDQITGHGGRSIENGVTPVIGPTMASALAQDLSFYSQLLTRYGYLMVLAPTLAGDNVKARRVQAQTTRYLEGTTRDGVAGTMAYFQVPELAPDQLIIAEGDRAVEVSAETYVLKSLSLESGTVADVAKALNGYSTVSKFMAGEGMHLLSVKNGPAYGGYSVKAIVAHEVYFADFDQRTNRPLKGPRYVVNVLKPSGTFACTATMWPLDTPPTWADAAGPATFPSTNYAAQLWGEPQNLPQFEKEATAAYEHDYFVNQLTANTSGSVNFTWDLSHNTATENRGLSGIEYSEAISGLGSWVACAKSAPQSTQKDLATKPGLLG